MYHLEGSCSHTGIHLDLEYFLNWQHSVFDIFPVPISYFEYLLSDGMSDNKKVLFFNDANLEMEKFPVHSS